MKITKQILTYILLGGLFVTPFIPFAVSSTLFFPFITGKGFIFRILIELLFGMYVFLAFLEPAYRPKRSWITTSILVFAGVILVADIFGANAYKSIWSNFERMEGFVLIAHLVLYYVVLSSMFRTSKRWNQFWNVSIGASVLMSVYGILQLAGKVAINQGGVRLDATFGNSAYLAIYLVFHIFLCLYMLVQAGKPVWQKWLYGVIAVLEFVILYYTATRGAILGLIGGLFLTALIVAFKTKPNLEADQKRGTMLRKTAYGFVIGILVLIGGFFLIRHASFVQKSPVLSRFASLSVSELETQGRYYVWPMALKGFAERPILGWGQENFNFVFNKFYDPRMYGQEQWFDRTHDIVLDWLIAGGLLGFLAYAGMYVALLYMVWRKKSLMTVAEKGILTGLIAAYVFHNIFVFDNLVSYMIFFAILAYVHAMSLAGDASQTAPSTSKFQTKMFSSEVIAYIVAPVVVVLTIGTVYLVNIPALEAGTTLIQAITPQQTAGPEQNLAYFKQAFAYNSFGSSEALEQLIQVSSQIVTATSDQVPDSIKQEYFDFTKPKIEEKLKQTPTDARYLVFAGSFFNRYGQYDVAIAYLTKAIEYSPKKQSIYFELGTSYLGKKDYQKAFDTFKTAYDLEPAYPDAKIIYAIGAIYTKNGPLVQQLLSTIDQNTVMSDNRFLRAYADIADYQSVIAILTARVQSDPTNLQYQISLASAYLQIGQKQKAIAIILQMEKEDPTFKAQGDTYIQQIQSSK